MIMFLSLAVVSILGCVICAALLQAAAPRDPQAALQAERRAEAAAPQFFAEGVSARTPEHAIVPVELVVSQIERHVRLEQAAAETFLELPTSESLHSRTTSPLLN